MADGSKRASGLGRGLSALLDEISAPASQAAGEATEPTSLPIAKIVPNPHQPRRRFDEAALKELAESIRRQGLLQPILVRPREDGLYEVVAGERRWRAAQIAQLKEVPVIVRALDESSTLEAALIENVQRTDLSPIEEAEGYRRLMREFGYTQDAIGRFVGKSRSHIANLLRLLELPPDVIQMIGDGQLTMGHARALVTAPDPSGLARQVVAQGLSVRKTEALAAKSAEPLPARTRRSAPPRREQNEELAALEAELSEALGLPVAIEHGAGGGRVTISYPDLPALDTLLQRLTRSVI